MASAPDATLWQLYVGTKADLRPGDLIEPDALPGHGLEQPRMPSTRQRSGAMALPIWPPPGANAGG